MPWSKTAGIRLVRERLAGAAVAPVAGIVSVRWSEAARAMAWSGGLVMAAGLVAAVHKVRQHL